MNENKILDNIRIRVGKENLSTSCRRDGCRVRMTGAPTPRVVVDADRAFPAHGIRGQRCDYVMFFFHGTARNNLFVIPIELKGRDINVSRAFNQLQAGANFAERFTSRDTSAKCFPLLFHKGISKRKLEKLKELKVRFRNRDRTIQTERCDSFLAQAVKKMTD